MSSPRSITPLPITEGRNEVLLFSSNALYRLEERTQRTTAQIGRALILQQGSIHLLMDLIWAGLEGSRIRLKSRPTMWTIEEVGDLLDEAGGPEKCFGPDGTWTRHIVKAFTGAFPEPEKKDDEGKKDGAGNKPADPPSPQA